LGGDARRGGTQKKRNTEMPALERGHRRGVEKEGGKASGKTLASGTVRKGKNKSIPFPINSGKEEKAE